MYVVACCGDNILNVSTTLQAKCCDAVRETALGYLELLHSMGNMLDLNIHGIHLLNMQCQLGEHLENAVEAERTWVT